MSSMSELRAGIAANIATIVGLRTESTVPMDPHPPVAVVLPKEVNYDESFARGVDEYIFTVQVIVGAVDERSAELLMDDYCSGSGSSSLKQAIQSDRTLGGKAFDLRVRKVVSYQQTPIGDINYLSALVDVQVFAQ